MVVIPFPLPRQAVPAANSGDCDAGDHEVPGFASAPARCPNPESDGSHGVYRLTVPPAFPGGKVNLPRLAGPGTAVRTPGAGGPDALAVPAPDWTQREAGMATAEYAIATLAAVAFAGLLAVVLGSDEVRGMLVSLIRSALTLG